MSNDHPQRGRLVKVSRWFRRNFESMSHAAMMAHLDRAGIRRTKIGKDFYADERALDGWIQRQRETLEA